MAQDEVILDGDLSLDIPLDGAVGLLTLIEAGIAQIIFNDDYTITFVMTDGREFTTGSIRGATGPQGIQGPAGPKGDTGDTGPAGPQGEKGESGERGEKGDTGSKGDKGDPFVFSDFTPEQLASLKGEKGDKGDKGDQGIQGLKGDTGEKGDKGEDGQDYVLTENDKQEIASLVDVPVDDVQIDGTSIVNNGIATIPIANTNNAGIVKINPSFGVGLINDALIINGANSNDIKAANNSTKAISTFRQHEATFYGLAKASGDITQSASNNAVGTYTDEAKAAIQTMLGVPSENDIITDVQIDGTSIVENGIASIPKASDGSAGVARGATGYGTRNIVASNGDTIIGIYGATDAAVKAGDNGLIPLTPLRQHKSVFYGLAKAAGDTTQAQSNNEVGTYTESAQSAISDMLNAPVQVSGMDPVIVAKSGIRYICGEVYTLNFTPSATGICDVIFTSGSTPTVLSLPNTVKMPDWFIVEANTTYEINIADGVYGGVMSWI
ncbi:MAG: collagen-like protein [Bacteroidota bacterium]|nr:collagen-like protein [Bacteroidota bacterium]